MTLQFVWLFLLVGLFGGLGAVIRTSFVKWEGWLAWGLLAANTAAASMVAWIWSGPPLPAGTNEVLIFGLAGGLSTFSTVAKVSFDFYHRGRILQALLVLALNLFVPLGAVILVSSLS
jgi:fluoride ion exporter CrcB/FEX